MITALAYPFRRLDDWCMTLLIGEDVIAKAAREYRATHHEVTS